MGRNILPLVSKLLSYNNTFNEAGWWCYPQKRVFYPTDKEIPVVETVAQNRSLLAQNRSSLEFVFLVYSISVPYSNTATPIDSKI